MAGLTVMPELSVIIPTYNRAAFLVPCVASVRACGVPAEVVVVDDGSTDDTAERARDLGNIVYVRQANAGPAPARNTGAAHSRGRFLAFLDSDDSWRPGVVPRLLDALQKQPDIDVAFAETLVGNPADGFEPLTPTVGEGTFDEIPCIRPGPGLRLMEREPFFLRMVTRNLVFLGSTVVRR
jgi:glycosyltransferase involved in cell wall biosynthesis